MNRTNSLPHSTPEEQGISSAAILNFVNAVEEGKHELHSYMLLRHGYVISEGWWAPYEAELPHMLFSLSKSFTSTAVGLAVHEGYLSIEDPVLSFFPEETPDVVSDNLAAMKVKHLLCMGTGHAEDTTGYLHQREDGNWIKAFLSRPVEHEPGTHFVYNSGATYMLSAIVQKVTGHRVLDYLTPRLFAPLGIEGATWETCPKGINTGGWGLSIKTEDIAKFGQLFLQKGVWMEQQLVPEDWIKEATARQISNSNQENIDWQQGYGYQFWRCRHNAYRGDGAFGQYCIVLPDEDAVLAITSGLDDMQAVLNLVWEHLLPAMKTESIFNDENTQKSLHEKLSSLALSLPVSEINLTAVEPICCKEYQMEQNEYEIRKLSFTFKEDQCAFKVWSSKGELTVSCGIGKWIVNETSPLFDFETFAASGTWTKESAFVMTWRYIKTPFYVKVTCCFDEGKVSITPSMNVSFGPKGLPVMQGTL